MWPDNETEKDFLNFSGVADTVAEIITQATGRPTSIGISGSWGAGKSSMIKLVRAALAEKDQNDPEQFIYVEFNAWLYQGYDDARAALLEVIATKLNEESEKRKTGTDKAKELLEMSFGIGASPLVNAGRDAVVLKCSIPRRPVGFRASVLCAGGAEEIHEAATRHAFAPGALFQLTRGGGGGFHEVGGARETDAGGHVAEGERRAGRGRGQRDARGGCEDRADTGVPQHVDGRHRLAAPEPSARLGFQL